MECFVLYFYFLKHLFIMYSDPLFFRLWFKRQTFVNILTRNLLQMYSDGKSFIGNVWNTIFYFVLTEPYTRSGSLSLLKPVCFFVLFSRNNGSPRPSYHGTAVFRNPRWNDLHFTHKRTRHYTTPVCWKNNNING